MPEKDVTIDAVFAAKTYTITISNIINGSVVADKTSAKVGEKIALTVTQVEGYELSEITIIEIAEDNIFTMPARDVTISAVFSLISEPAADASISGEADVDGNHTIKYSVPEGMDYTLIVAKYNDDGSVKNIEVMASADGTNNGELIVDSTENVKVMLWSDLSAMVPLCQNHEVK